MQTGTVQSRMNYYPFGKLWEGGEQSTNRWNYNNKETQQITGHNIIDYGARMYDPDLGRWPSVDPLAEKYLPFSPYNFTLNNPVRFIDFDGRDIYIVDPDGNMILALRTDEENRVYSHDGKGNITGFKDVKDKNILGDLYQQRDDFSGRYAITGSHEAGDLFLFFADNTDVEWGLTGYQGKNGRQYVLRTSHEKGRTAFYEPDGFGTSNQFFAIHGHPDPNGTKVGSGYLKGGYIGDALTVRDNYRDEYNEGIIPHTHYVIINIQKNYINIHHGNRVST